MSPRRYFVWCKATSPLDGEGRHWCYWKGYRAKNPEKACPKCGGVVHVHDREEKEAT